MNEILSPEKVYFLPTSLELNPNFAMFLTFKLLYKPYIIYSDKASTVSYAPHWPISGSLGAVRYRCCQHSARFYGELVLKKLILLVIVYWSVSTVFLCNLENNEILSLLQQLNIYTYCYPFRIIISFFHCLIVCNRVFKLVKKKQDL